VGHPNGKLWEANVKPDAMSSKDGIRLYFQSGFIGQGHSGGALLNDRWELIGMLRSDQPPHGEAIALDTIIAWLAAHQYEVDLRPPGAPGSFEQLISAIETDVTYACAELASFPNDNVKGEAIIAELSGPLKNVEEDPRFSSARSPVLASLYRCVGGAYLIHNKLEINQKLLTAIPYLKRSLDLNPAQPLLKQNIAVLETFLKNQGGDTKIYLTTVLQIFQGGDSPAVSNLANDLTSYTLKPEYQAMQWLMHQATNPPITTFLEGIRLMIKKQSNADVTVDVSNRKLPDGLVEVRAKVGSTVFLWTVDYARKQYAPRNEMTQKLMEVIAKTRP